MNELSGKASEKKTDDFGVTKKRGRALDLWRRFKKNKLAVVALVIVIILILSAVFANQLAPYNYKALDPSNAFQFPDASHIFGTDNFGRDLFSRILYGGRISLLVSVVAVAISLVIGGFLGATAGYTGGKYESVVMRAIDIVMAIPGFLLAVSVSAALGGGLLNTSVAIAISGIPGGTRLMRATVLTLKDQEFTEAARALGNSHMRIIFKHIIPNTLSPIIVDSTMKIGVNILMISGLSFVGLGVQPPTPEWGSIMAAGRDYIRDFWPIVTFPGIAIMLTMFGFNVLGDGLRDALDPKLKR